jgi:hypothetical protein
MGPEGACGNPRRNVALHLVFTAVQPTALAKFRVFRATRARLIFGGIFVAVGLPIVLIGSGMLPVNPRDVHAPLWVIGCVGLAFVAAGSSVAIGAASPTSTRDGSLPPDAPLPLRLLQYALSLVVVAGLATVGSWVAFGTGERKFKSSISAFGVSHSGAGDEWTGRVIFGVGAVLCWLFLILVARQGWRRLFPQSKSEQDCQQR